jgi:hypothetical protein
LVQRPLVQSVLTKQFLLLRQPGQPPPQSTAGRQKTVQWDTLCHLLTGFICLNTGEMWQEFSTKTYRLFHGRF